MAVLKPLFVLWTALAVRAVTEGQYCRLGGMDGWDGAGLVELMIL